MSAVAAAIAAMEERGLCAEDILHVVKAIVDVERPVVDEAAERRRAADRERKRNVRRMSADNSADTAPSPLDPPLMVSPTPPSCNPPYNPPNPDVRPKRVRTQYPDDFEEFWKGYPTDALMSKKAAAAVWARMAPEDRAAALKALPAFRAHCQAHPDYRPKHAQGWLSQARWEGLNLVADKINSRVFVRDGTPAWGEWRRYNQARGKAMPTPMQTKGFNEPGWYFESEYPPTEEQAA